METELKFRDLAVDEIFKRKTTADILYRKIGDKCGCGQKNAESVADQKKIKIPKGELVIQVII